MVGLSQLSTNQGQELLLKRGLILPKGAYPTTRPTKTGEAKEATIVRKGVAPISLVFLDLTRGVGRGVTGRG